MVTVVAVNILVVLVFSVVGIKECRRLSQKYPDFNLETALKRASYLYGLIPFTVLLLAGTALVMAVARNRPSLFWKLPLWLEYHLFTICWGVIFALFAFTFALTAAVAVRSRHEERRKIIAAAILFVGAIQIVQWIYTHPVAGTLGEEISRLGMVIQTSPVSCAAASGATIARLLGQEKTEREMAALYGTSQMGTSAAQIIVGMERIGFISRKVEVKSADPKMVVPPAIFFVNSPMSGPESHAVAYLGYEEGKAVIWDPLHGVRMDLGKKDVAALWKGRGLEFRRVEER
jgi:hypothetical protein